ncbi:MAG TPA: alpha/beta fold hydrolase [candidate division Zixibacteria bacterium]|nr:alpha/beta fold hydrolase [candidate division Zixibacteria bacterium]
MRIVLLPGMDGSGLQFRRFVEQLGDSFTAQVISYPQSGPQDYDTLTEHVTRRLPTSEPYILLGESFGGPLAFRIAAKRPVNLRGVVFVATFLQAPRTPGMRFLRLIPWRVVPLIRPPAFVIRWFSVGKGATREMLDDFWAATKDAGHDTLRKRLETILHLAAPTESLALPCLYLRGAQDRVIGADSVELFRERCPNLVTQTIPGPHLLLQAEAAAGAEIIRRFAAGLEK